MSTATGPDFVALQTRDIEAVASFYETHLGLHRAAQSPPGAVVFTTTPIPFAIREPLPGAELDKLERPGQGVALWMHCDDSQQLHDALVAARVEISSPPKPTPFGNAFTFLDPAGYAVTMHDGG